MGKSVAVQGDVKTDAVARYDGKPAYKGSWKAQGPVSHPYSALSVNGDRVLYRVECVFEYSGYDSANNNAPVKGTSEIVLDADKTVLQRGRRSVLIDGDVKSDDHGNRLYIHATSHVRTD